MKIFSNMKNEGVFQYIRNIAGWTARPEIHLINDKKSPSEWRPKSIIYSIQRGIKPSKAVWAIDCSESVKENDFYHDELEKIIHEYYKEGDEIYLFDSNYKKISYQELIQFIKNRDGYPGISSSNIAKIAACTNISDNLIIVTDGSVIQNEIERSDHILMQHRIRFNFVATFIILNEDDPEIQEMNQISGMNIKIEPDLSVGAPYSRNCQSITINIPRPNERVVLASLTSKDIGALKNIDGINTIQEFDSSFLSLHKIIRSSMIGRPTDESLVHKLDSLHQRIIETGLNKDEQNHFDQEFDLLMKIARGSLLNDFSFNPELNIEISIQSFLKRLSDRCSLTLPHLFRILDEINTFAQFNDHLSDLQNIILSMRFTTQEYNQLLDHLYELYHRVEKELNENDKKLFFDSFTDLKQIAIYSKI